MTIGVGAVDTYSGRVLYRHPINIDASPVVMALDEIHHHVILGAGIYVYILDEKSGAVVRTITLTQRCTALAVDQRADRVLVTGIPSQDQGDNIGLGTWLAQVQQRLPWLRYRIPQTGTLSMLNL